QPRTTAFQSDGPPAQPSQALDEEAEDSNYWTCPRCGDAVAIDVVHCPACGAASEAIQGEQDFASALPPESLEEEREPLVDLENLTLSYADSLASRAFRATIIGIMLTPFLLYSLWLIVRLAFLPDKLTTLSKVKVYVALAIDV